MARPAFAPELHHDQLQFADATAQGRAPVFLPAIQRMRFNRAVQRRHEAIPVDRLLDEVVSAAAQAAQREVVLAVACDHQRGRVRPAPQDLGQERETVHPGHPDIGDDRVVVPAGDPPELGRRRVGRIYRDPIHAEPKRLGKRLQQSRVVVDDEHARLFAPQLLRDLLQFDGAVLQGQLAVLHETVKRVRGNRAVQRRDELIAVDRLLDEVVGAAAQGANREVFLAVACDHEGGRVGPAPQDLGQERETVHARHPDIGDDRVVVAGGDPVERRHCRVGRVHRDPIHSEPERLGKRLQQSRVVVDNENVQRCHGAEVSLSAGKGNWMRNVAPSPGVLTIEIVPPCSLTIPYVMDKPRPVPFPTSLVVKNGSKIRCSSPDGIPCPVSTNAISIVAEPTEAETRIALRGESTTASRAFANRLMNTCSSWMGLPTTTGSSGPRSSVTSISCSRSCSCTRDSARSITGLREIGSRLTGAARPNVRRCEMICVAFDTCCRAWRSSRTICPLSAAPSSMRSIALPTNKPVLLRGLLSSWATPVVSSPSVASLPAWTSCSYLSRSSCSRRCISAVVSRRSPMMWIIAFRLSARRRLDRWES